MSFGPASSKNRNKRKSASFSQADSRLRGGGNGLDSRVPSKGRNPSGSSTKKAPTTSEELYKAPTNEPMRAPSKVLFQVQYTIYKLVISALHLNKCLLVIVLVCSP